MIMARLKRSMLMGRPLTLVVSRLYTLGPRVLLLLRKNAHLLEVPLMFVT